MAQLIMDHPGSGCFGTSLAPSSNTLSLSDCCSVANLEKILMHRNAVTPVLCGEVGLDVGFDVLPGGCALNLQQVQHKFGDGVGLVQVWCLNVRRIQRGHDVIPVPVLGPEGVGGPAQFKPVAEKVVHHVHAPALPVLQHHDGHAGWRHPRYEAFQVREPLLRRNVIERMGTEDQIPLRSRLGGQDRQANRLGGWERLLQLVRR